MPGLDLTDRAVLDGLVSEMAKTWAVAQTAAPLIGGQAVTGIAKPVTDPAEHQRPPHRADRPPERLKTAFRTPYE